MLDKHQTYILESSRGQNIVQISLTVVKNIQAFGLAHAGGTNLWIWACAVENKLPAQFARQITVYVDARMLIKQYSGM